MKINLASNIRQLIELQGLDTALQSIEIMVDDLGEDATIDELDIAIIDEVSYSIEDAQ